MAKITRPDPAEQQEVGQQRDTDAGKTILAVEVSLDPVVGSASPIGLERLALHCFGAIQADAGEEHAPDTVDLRAMRILRRFAACVVLAVDGHPLAGHHAGRQPEPESEEMADDRVQRQTPVRLVAVQEDRDARDRDVGQYEPHGHVAPERQIPQAVERHNLKPPLWCAPRIRSCGGFMHCDSSPFDARSYSCRVRRPAWARRLAAWTSLWEPLPAFATAWVAHFSVPQPWRRRPRPRS